MGDTAGDRHLIVVLGPTRLIFRHDAQVTGPSIRLRYVTPVSRKYVVKCTHKRKTGLNRVVVDTNVEYPWYENLWEWDK